MVGTPTDYGLNLMPTLLLVITTAWFYHCMNTGNGFSAVHHGERDHRGASREPQNTAKTREAVDRLVYSAT